MVVVAVAVAAAAAAAVEVEETITVEGECSLVCQTTYYNFSHNSSCLF